MLEITQFQFFYFSIFLENTPRFWEKIVKLEIKSKEDLFFLEITMIFGKKYGKVLVLKRPSL